MQILKNHIILTNKKSGNINKLCYCKACYDKYGENHPELKTIIDKTDRILTHFKNCPNFANIYNQEEKEEIFSLAIQKKVLGKRPSKFFFSANFLFILYDINVPLLFLLANDPSSSKAASESTSINQPFKIT